MTEERMEKAAQRPKLPAGKPGPESDSAAKETKVVRHDTPVPDEDDPQFKDMGSTHVISGDSDATPSGEIQAPANYTRLAPDMVLGKDVVQLGDFKLLKKLGEGAMGAVYKAQQTSFNRVVALKILFPHIAKNPKLVQRLYREGKVMGQLDHPNIVQAYAVDEQLGCHYVAMEYITGQSMQKWLTQITRLPVGDAVRVTLDCARALAYAHKNNIIHRDIKPDNILLTKTGVVKVADLGMVKADDEEMSLTQTGHAVGTPWFMPLEQARNAKEIDGRADIYALGCTLYAFLTGKPPFMGNTIVDVIQAKEVGNFPPARQNNSDVPERLDLILIKMTAKAPKNRYQNCDELIKDLESLALASDKLGFLQAKPVKREPTPEEFAAMGQTSVTAAARSRADVEFKDSAAAAFDPNVWYVQTHKPDGTSVTRQYTTAQLQKMLAEGTMKPIAKASHQPNEGYRTLGTYKEFQGSAMSTLAKKGADKNTAKFRGIFKKIEEKEKEKEDKERRRQDSGSTLQATSSYWLGIFWKVLPAGLGIVVLIALLYFAASIFR